eukprot:CAMPEP_0179491448 /NCGR_PEP_ID=MMETSP0799-20121207/66096_1 /TAXON_ID=46947 /ORGANISM="Geminigera cryophila, Strain CCMP2564" /LENGTH=535 /DNA_ID=CAMNT_0021307905 /DNA_START=351 /DNA_END=1956 /DNA_ORIENTATION=-
MATVPRFRVAITGVIGCGITNCKGNKPDTKLKFAWDVGFRTFATEAADDNVLDQTWSKTFDGDGVRFEYTTKHPESLHQKMMKIQVWDKNLLKDEYIGSAEIDLHSICTGPPMIKLNISRQNGDLAGTLHLSVTMQQIAEVHFAVNEVTLTCMRDNLAYEDLVLKHWVSLDYKKTKTRSETQITGASVVSCQRLSQMKCDASLEELCMARLEFDLQDKSKQSLGTASLPLLHTVLLNQNGVCNEKSRVDVHFKAEDASVFATLQAFVYLQDSPVFAQMVGGFMDSMGEVRGSRPLWDHSYLPAFYNKHDAEAKNLNPVYPNNAALSAQQQQEKQQASQPRLRSVVQTVSAGLRMANVDGWAPKEATPSEHSATNFSSINYWGAVRAAIPATAAHALATAEGGGASVVLPAGWRQVADPTGRVYYVHDASKTTSWKCPSDSSSIGTPPSAPEVGGGGGGGTGGAEDLKSVTGKVVANWSVRYAEGKPYYLNHVTQITSWSLPVAAQLPDDWEERYDTKQTPAKAYYSNHVTKVTQW